MVESVCDKPNESTGSKTLISRVREKPGSWGQQIYFVGTIYVGSDSCHSKVKLASEMDPIECIGTIVPEREGVERH